MGSAATLHVSTICSVACYALAVPSPTCTPAGRPVWGCLLALPPSLARNGRFFLREAFRTLRLVWGQLREEPHKSRAYAYYPHFVMIKSEFIKYTLETSGLIYFFFN